MNTQKQIKGNIGLLEQCESFKLVSSVDGFTTYHGFSFDDEIIELVFCGESKYFSIVNGFDILNMIKGNAKLRLFVNYAIL